LETGAFESFENKIFQGKLLVMVMVVTNNTNKMEPAIAAENYAI